VQERPRLLTPGEQAAIRRLAADIPALWTAPTTTDAERKEILRQVVSRIVVTSQGSTEQVQLAIEWAGGTRTEDVLIRPVARLSQLSYYPQLCERVRELVGEGLTAVAIASRLNAEGYRPPKRREQFGPQGVRELLVRLGLHEPLSRSTLHDDLGTDEWWVQSLAHQLGMPEVTLHHWIRRGWVRARQQAEPPRRWVVWADAAEVERLAQLHQRPAGEQTRRLWIEDADGSGDIARATSQGVNADDEGA
jgi:hypothetical protein